MTSVVVSEAGNRSQAMQLIDGLTAPTRKWLSLQGSTLDGSFHPIDGTGAMQIGWWGTTLSDVTGILAAAPTITATLDQVISTSSMQIFGDSLLNEYPVDFTIKLYDASDILLLTDVVTGNTQINCIRSYPSTYTIKKYIITVTRVNKAARSVKLLEGSTYGLIIRSDSLTVQTTGTALYTAFGSADQALIAVTDRTLSIINQLSANEVATLNLVDTGILTNNLKSPDAINASLTDLTHLVTAELLQVDELLVSSNVEDMQIVADIYDVDQITVNGSDLSTPTNIHTVVNSHERRVYGKVEITYTDPFTDQTIVGSANETQQYTDPNQTADNVTKTPYRWFTLYDNKLDGLSHPMDSSLFAEVGWWSRSLSDADGNFTTSPQLTMSFDPRGIVSLNVVGEDRSNVFPVDFNISCYSATSELLRSQEVVGNDQITWKMDLSDNPVSLCTQMVLTVHKINKPLYQCRILEFITSIVQTYTGDDRVVAMHLLEERDITEGSLPVGNITSNELDITLNNTDRYFDPANGSPISTLLKPNRRIKAWFGAEVVPDVIEWHQLGIFWTTAWSSPKQDVTTIVTARDRLNLMAQTTYSTNILKFNVSMYQLAEDVMQDFGLLSTEYSINDSLKDMIVPIAWFDSMTHREALRLIAEAALAVVYCDSEAVVQIGESNTPLFPMTKLDENVNVINCENPQDWTQIVNDVSINWNPLAADTEQEVLGATSLQVNLDPGTSTTMQLAFQSSPCANVGPITLTGGSDLTLGSYQIFAWGVEVTIINLGSTTEILDSVLALGTPYKVSNFVVNTQDVASIRALSKLTYSLSNHLIQSRELAASIANRLLTTYSDPLRKITLATRGDIAIELGDRITVVDSGVDGILTSQKYAYDGALSSTIELIKL